MDTSVGTPGVFETMTGATSRLAKSRIIAVLPLLALTEGCGVLSTARTVFPEQVTDAADNPLYLEPVRNIVDDPDLSDDEKADALRELGLEDEELIDVLVEQGLSESGENTDGLDG